jgi:hypothetical protein
MAVVRYTPHWPFGKVYEHLNSSLRTAVSHLSTTFSMLPDSTQSTSLYSVTACADIPEACVGRKDSQNFAFLPAMRRGSCLVG